MKFLKKLVLSAFLISSLLATSANAGDCKARLGKLIRNQPSRKTLIIALTTLRRKLKWLKT
jgi:hypothetical protein